MCRGMRYDDEYHEYTNLYAYNYDVHKYQSGFDGQSTRYSKSNDKFM
jgi:hypothetical protein